MVLERIVRVRVREDLGTTIPVWLWLTMHVRGSFASSKADWRRKAWRIVMQRDDPANI